jgi:hypothetical protein
MKSDLVRPPFWHVHATARQQHDKLSAVLFDKSLLRLRYTIRRRQRTLQLITLHQRQFLRMFMFHPKKYPTHLRARFMKVDFLHALTHVFQDRMQYSTRLDRFEANDARFVDIFDL